MIAPQPPPEPASQRLFGAVLILLTALGLILLCKDLARRPPGKSRIDWPPASTATP